MSHSLDISIFQLQLQYENRTINPGLSALYASSQSFSIERTPTHSVRTRNCNFIFLCNSSNNGGPWDRTSVLDSFFCCHEVKWVIGQSRNQQVRSLESEYVDVCNRQQISKCQSDFNQHLRPIFWCCCWFCFSQLLLRWNYCFLISRDFSCFWF